MPGAEGLDGGSPELRPTADQAPVSQGYSLDADSESFEDRVDETMQRSGMRLTRSEAEDYVRSVDNYVGNVEQRLAELQAESEGDENVEG